MTAIGWKNSSHPILESSQISGNQLKCGLLIVVTKYNIDILYDYVKITNFSKQVLSNWKSVSDGSGGMDFEIEVLMVNKQLCNIGNVTGIMKSWNMRVCGLFSALEWSIHHL